MEKLISIVMSTLNTPYEYLTKAIDSILNQTYKNFEFIIIVDGGNDDQYIKNKYDDNRIIIIKHENTIGLTKSLNEGIKKANGKYIVRMDSDDYSRIDRIEQQVDFMEKNINVGICSCFYKEFENSNKEIKEVYIKPEEVKCKMFFTNIIAHGSVMFRKDFLEKNNLEYNEDFTYSQDFELWTRANKIGNIQIIPNTLFEYRVHNGQISKSKSEKQNELYYSILIRNLNDLDIEEENLKYLLMLNGRKRVEDKKKLKKFIRVTIERNSLKKIYDCKRFKNILWTYYCITCIKSRKFFIPNRFFFLYVIKKIKYRSK